MKQSRFMSIIEAIANVVVGYGIAVLTQLIVFLWFGLPARVGDSLAMAPCSLWLAWSGDSRSGGSSRRSGSGAAAPSPMEG